MREDISELFRANAREYGASFDVSPDENETAVRDAVERIAGIVRAAGGECILVATLPRDDTKMVVVAGVEICTEEIARPLGHVLATIVQ